MPFEPVPDDLVALRFPIGEVEEPIRRISLPEEGDNVFGAAFRGGNWLVSGIANADRRYKPEPKYSPLNDIANTPYLLDYADEFVGSRSGAETKSIMARIDRQNRDRETVASGGWFGTVAGFGAGLIDPLNLAPGGVIYRGYRTGATLKSATSAMGMFAGTSAAQEALLHASQPVRTIEESIFNIGTATVIGALLGAGASRFATAAERKAAMEAWDAAVKRPVKEGKPIPTGPDASAGAATTDIRALTPQDMGVVGKALGKARKSVEAIPYVGKPIAKVLGAPAALVRNIGPTNRVAYGEFVEAKRAMFDLAESPGILFKENLEGAPTVSGGGPAIETHARMAILGGRYRMQQELDALWKNYYWGEEKVRFGQLKAKVAELTGRQEQTQLSYEAFKKQVAIAMRRKDEHEIPQVTVAAKFLRKEIFEPWKKLAIETKLLPEDVSVDETALSYLTRLYDHDKIVKQRPQFEGRITGWLKTTQAHNAQLRSSLEANLDLRKAKERQLRKIEGRMATTLRRYESVEARLSERQMEATATEHRADTVMARQEEARQAVDEMKQFISDLREADNTPEIGKRIADLEREVKDLESGMKAITEKDLEVIDKAARKGVLTGPMRKVARIMTGSAKLPKGVEPFWKYVARLGGVKDDGGDLLAMIGEVPKTRGKAAKLFNSKGLQWDDLQTRLAEDFQELRARDYGNEGEELAGDFSDDIRTAIAESYAGKEPAWYLAERGSEDDNFIVSLANELDELQDKGLVPEFKTMDDFAEFFSGRDAGMSEADYDAIIASLDASPASMEHRIASLDVQAMADTRRQTVEVLKDSLTKAKSNLQSAKIGGGKAGVRVSEAGIAAARNMRRADILDMRSTQSVVQHELLSMARANAEQEITGLRTKAEADLAAWKGKSSAEALIAIARREEAELIRAIETDVLLSGQGDWRLEDVVVTVDGRPATVQAGPAVDFLVSRMNAVKALMECVRGT